MSEDVRWQQRLQSYERAFHLLREALAREPAGLSELEKEGTIHRFKFTFELAWKALADYLAYSGVTLEQVTPRSVLKQAFSAKLISDGQLWIDMLNHRNLLSHTYNEKVFGHAVEEISRRYFKALQELYELLKRNCTP
jgi:nucleotidyltransferase substrate binding protein (TIGR01987 family)